ncbi:patatin-like phospholipase family protein [Acinetobacter sp. 187]|uniref:patatin-like phospholipase family protein n=1 Tax=Acinetobacter lanii TaxID=2715163 RepID=UPI001409DB38|nr:patatin-like phospholipase family protein [Acinetobacter lanii]NHC04621.1 patatin-like phospholipase family protein [Acinetobacter lanii]
MKLLKIFCLGLCISLSACQHSAIKSQTVAAKPVQEASSDIDYTAFKKNKANHKPVVALVLGSGGARGYAHIGVIEVLEQKGIKPDFIVGTSAGSIVGSIYASGKSAQELRDIALKMQVHDVRDFNIKMQGFLDGKKVENYVNKHVGNLPLEELKIPLYVVATELKHGEKVVFNKGNTGQAVRASISIPSMFIPANINGNQYVDGGLVSPVPVNIARELGADIVIAVDILAQPIHTETTNLWGMFNQNINIMQSKLAEEELKNADIVIQPDLREKAHIFDVKGRELTMQAGIDAASEKMEQIEKLFENQPNIKSKFYSAQQ